MKYLSYIDACAEDESPLMDVDFLWMLITSSLIHVTFTLCQVPSMPPRTCRVNLGRITHNASVLAYHGQMPHQ